ncbi:hypothetical protein DFH11DRAFT_1546499 [Phellopilus nigrolimitatus]|nr:hypothetical protein DFH11DRAFT_1546499 [Phellopilus nigrolimitatus]
MFRKSRASSSPTSPNSPSTETEGSRGTPTHDISDDYEVVQTPSGSNPNSIPSSNLHPPTRRQSSPPTPGVTPPPRVRQASSRDDWYPSWLPRRPPPPAPASTVASELGHRNSPVPYMSGSPSNAGTTRGTRPVAPGVHMVTASYDTGYTGYTEGDSGEYVDIGEYDNDNSPGGAEGGEERVAVGRRQTPRSVRIVSGGTAGNARRQASSRNSRRALASANVQAVRSRKEGRSAGHVHGNFIAGPKPWWRGTGTASTPLSPTVFSPSPFPGGYASVPGTGAPPSSVPPHMRTYFPHPGMHGVRDSGVHGNGFPAGMTPPVRPRFRAPYLDLGILRSPSAWMKLLYILWPLWVYGLVLLQTFFDLNSVYCLVQIAINPTPLTPPSGSSAGQNTSSRRNWTLGAAVFGICWFFWVVGVVLLYEVVYCWWRVWRSKRPLIMPLYLSAPAFSIVCMTSYVNFCFFRHLRSSARPLLPLPKFLKACGTSSSASSTVPSGRVATPSALSPVTEARDSQQGERDVSSPSNLEDKENTPIIPSTTYPTPVILNAASGSFASWGDWFAETCYFYGQNLPTVALLLPRAALCLALLLAYSSAQPEDIVLGSLGLMKRDRTFFRSDGSLSGYARGMLWVNVAWAAWRVAVLLLSWIGLWWTSGQMCAGVCGPRFRWEEPEEKFGYGGAGYDEEELGESHGVLATWSWRECTRARVVDTYELCLFPPPVSTRTQEKEQNVSEKPAQCVGGGIGKEEEDAVLDRVLAAAGLPTVPSPARRGALRGELFNTPPEIRRELPEEGAVEEIVVLPAQKPIVKEEIRKKSKEHVPPTLSPYPFTTYPAQTSSKDPIPHPQEKIPFPPSPRNSEHSDREGDENDNEEDEEDLEEGDELGLELEEPSSSGRASGSMSSLGQQIPSRFPFQFRHVTRRSRGGRSSTGTGQTQQSQSTSNKTGSLSYGASGTSRSTSTPDRRRESQDSASPWSPSQLSPGGSSAQSPITPRVGSGSSGFGSPLSVDPGSSSPIPMPPRHSHRTRRERASLPSLPVSALPAAFPNVHDPRLRTQSASTAGSGGFGPHPLYESSDDEEEEEDRGEGITVEGDEGMLTDPEPEGSQEEAEREDSVGLLSGGPSPRSSLGGLRSRSNLSLTNLNLGIPHSSRRSRHSSASSHSNSRSSRSSGSRSVSLSGSAGSRAHSARSRSVSVQARSRAHSLIQSIGGASTSNVSFEMGMRTRAHSLARVSEVGSLHRRSGSAGSGAGSVSGTSYAGSPAQLGSPGDDTFGQPIRLRIDSPEVSDARREWELEHAHGQSLAKEQEEAVLSEPTVASETAVEPARGMRQSRSNVSGLAPSHYSQETVQRQDDSPAGLQVSAPAFSSLPIPTGGSRPLREGPSIISSANESLITHPASQEGSSDTAGRTPSSYGTVTYEPEHVHGQGGGWRPA